MQKSVKDTETTARFSLTADIPVGEITFRGGLAHLRHRTTLTDLPHQTGKPKATIMSQQTNTTNPLCLYQSLASDSQNLWQLLCLPIIPQYISLG